MESDKPEAVELLPCPFCGGNPRAWGEQRLRDGECWESIGCANLDCAFEPQTDYLPWDDAVKAWNTRAPDAQAGWETEDEKWARRTKDMEALMLADTDAQAARVQALEEALAKMTAPVSYPETDVAIATLPVEARKDCAWLTEPMHLARVVRHIIEARTAAIRALITEPKEPTDEKNVR